MSKIGIGRAIAAGFLGTVVMTLLMVIKQNQGILPALDPVVMLTKMGHAKLGLPREPWVGWVLHFIMGSIVWAIIYAFVNLILPGPGAVKGLIFGVLAWLVMMLVAMPMAGKGFFGMKMGILAPILALVLHLVYGLFLGWTYALMMRRR